MISFIVIGRNEARSLHACLLSIYKVIKECDFKTSEVIYVDSNSSDNSIEISREFPLTSLKIIRKPYNAAIARNVGALNAKGDIFVFVDGDTEIQPSFFKKHFIKEKPTSDFMTGNMLYQYHAPSGEFLRQVVHTRVNSGRTTIDYRLSATTFIIKKEIWHELGGMDPRYKKSQDYDLALRAAKKGFHIQWYNDDINIHSLIDYHNVSRGFEELKNGDFYFSRCLIYRSHLLNIKMWSVFFKNERSLIVLILSSLIAILFGNPMPIMLYILAIILKVQKAKKLSFKERAAKTILMIVQDVVIIPMFFLFHPPKILQEDVEYKVVN